jgi:hypothetical protein
MPLLRHCLVTIRLDPGSGRVHQSAVDATSLHEAAVLGLETAQRDSGTTFRPETSVNVQPVDSEVAHTICVKAIKAWLARTAGAPNEIVQRRRLRDRLDAHGLVL